MQSHIPTVSVCVVCIPITSLLGFLLWSLSQSMTSESLFLFLPVHLIHLNSAHPSSLLVFILFVQPFSYFDSNDYPHRLNETLSSLTELRSLIRDGSRCQTRSANWLVEKAEITDSEVSPVKPNLSHSERCHFLSTVATVLALESTDLRAFVVFAPMGFSIDVHYLSEWYVTNFNNKNTHGIRRRLKKWIIPL